MSIWRAAMCTILQRTQGWATQKAAGTTLAPPNVSVPGHTFTRAPLAAKSRARLWTPRRTPRRKPAPSPSATRTGISRSTTAPSARRCSTSPSSTTRAACSPTTPASPRRQAASPRSPTSTATWASCSIAAIRSTSSPSTAISWKPATCCSTANCRRRNRSTISTIASRATPWCTSRWPGFSRVSGATRIRWR